MAKKTIDRLLSKKLGGWVEVKFIHDARIATPVIAVWDTTLNPDMWYFMTPSAAKKNIFQTPRHFVDRNLGLDLFPSRPRAESETDDFIFSSWLSARSFIQSIPAVSEAVTV